MKLRKSLLIVCFPIFIGFAFMFWKPLRASIRKYTMTTTTDKQVIVVGSGLAGLSAASRLIALGISVHLLERSAKPGGNSIKASSGINGAPTKYQPGTDTFFYEDTWKSAGSAISTYSDERRSLISTLTNESSSAIEWLVKEGVDLSVVAQLGGHSFPRTHRGAGNMPPGASIILTLLKKLNSNPLFHLTTSAVVTKILRTESVIKGVEYNQNSKMEILNGPVIFASGGFAGDTNANGMLAKYRPDIASFPSTNEHREGSQPLLTASGAQLIDMEYIQIHPTSFVDPNDLSNPVKFLAAEMLRGEGGVLLHDGERFVNEMETRKIVTEAILLTPSNSDTPRQYDIQIVMDESAYLAAKSHVDFYIFKKLMRKSTISALHPSAFSTLKIYASSATSSAPDLLGRTSFGHWKLLPENITPETVVYIGTVTPAIHFTMGGVRINSKSQVLDNNDIPIDGLWAAGEVTGGVHGANRLGGSSLLEGAVFGRIAGREAAKFIGKMRD